MQRRKRGIVLILLCFLLTGLLAGCGQQKGQDVDAAASGQRIYSLEELEHGKLGILTGSVYDSVAKERFPEAEMNYYSSHADMIVSMEQGKLDAVLEDHIIYTTMNWENLPVTVLDEPVRINESAYILGKDAADSELLSQLNAFIAKSKEDGTIEALEEKWLSDKEPEDGLDYRELTGENGTIKVAACSVAKPMSYVKGDLCAGLEVDLLTLFAQEYGYALQVDGLAFESLIPGISTGKYDIASGSITITEERKESVTFSTSHMSTYGVAIVYKDHDQTAGFGEKVKDSFEKTFIKESRWKLILEGIGVTLLISISAAVCGTLLGFGLYMLVRSDVKGVNTLARGIAKVYSKIVAGTPVVVILMILFYVIFGKFRDISGVLVAIIGFTLTFGAFVYDHLTVSVNNVDKGQTEAAYALGYTKNKTFFRIVFPQAMSVFLPSYCGQAIELIKATAVVGYIAVNDLTKVGDIIRSNTYEAFFPLISTAVIYFILTWIISALLGRVKVQFEPKRRKKEDILKGVKVQ